MHTQKVILVILDGWGKGPKPEADAIFQAETPFVDMLYRNYPNAELVTFGELVGLPEGQMGNSEVGHLNIGAGRVVYQELARINKAIRQGELAKNSVLKEALEYARQRGKALYLMGLVSDGGVHSHIDHLKALCDIAADAGLERIFIHAFTDGRDTDPESGAGFLEDLLNYISGQPAALASVVGRYYAMDRDKRWERVKVAYDLLVHGKGEPAQNPLDALRQSYENGVTDEFVKPIVAVREDGNPIATLRDGDVLLCFNFRTDRPRQISRVLTQEDMPEHGMHKLELKYVTMTRYDETFQHIKVLFENESLKNTLGEVLAKAGKTQVRIAETEKYPHVTYFFSGGKEEVLAGERRILIPSPKEVPTYDHKPEMSAYEVKDAIVADIKGNTPDFICLNFANTDMVGHTGVFAAAKKAAEVVDGCLREVITAALEHHYEAIIIADHGNSDYMINEDGSPNTAHTKNPVPVIYVSRDASQYVVHSGKLADIAPTILTLYGMEIPEDMDGEVLIAKRR